MSSICVLMTRNVSALLMKSQLDSSFLAKIILIFRQRRSLGMYVSNSVSMIVVVRLLVSPSFHATISYLSNKKGLILINKCHRLSPLWYITFQLFLKTRCVKHRLSPVAYPQSNRRTACCKNRKADTKWQHKSLEFIRQ